jgi:hypothetical protein
MKKSKAKAKTGRCSRLEYWEEDDNRLEELRSFVRTGATHQDIANYCGIKIDTVYRWMQKKGKFYEAVKESKASADAKIENALYKRAIGYEVEETKKTLIVGPDGEKTQKFESYMKHILPDVGAQIFWLKNRKPLDWRDRREFEVNGTVGLVQIIDDIPQDIPQIEDGTEQ